jgi:hypothetical protein
MSFEEQTRQSVDTLLARLGGDLERGVRSLVAELLGRAVEERARAAEEAAREAREAATRQLEDAVRLAREDAARQLEEAVRAVREDAACQLEEAVRSAREEAARLRDEAVEQARRELDEQYRRALEEVEQAAHDELAQVRAEAERLAGSLAAPAALDADGAGTPPRASGTGERDAGLAALPQGARIRRAEAGEALSAVENTMRAAEREAALAGLGRLVDALGRLDACGSLRETLDALADAVAGATARSMLLVVRRDRIRGWRVSGFAAAPDPSAIDLPVAEAGELGEAVRTGQARQMRADAFDSRVHPALAFARLTAHEMGLVVPVTLGRDTVAVIYADDGGAPDREVPAGWPEVVEILARHASRCLEALTALKSAPRLATAQAPGREPAVEAARASGSPAPGARSAAHAHEDAPRLQGEGGARGGGPFAAGPGAVPAPPAGTTGGGAFDPDPVEAARRHAHLLVSEIKLFHESAVRAGREHGDLRVRLRHEIDRARRLFYDHVPDTTAGRDLIFERELVETLAGGRPELLGASTSEPA